MSTPKGMAVGALVRIDYHQGKISSCVKEIRRHWETIDSRMACAQQLLAQAHKLVCDAGDLVMASRAEVSRAGDDTK